MSGIKKELELATYWQICMSSPKGTGVSALTPREIGQIKCLFRKTGMLSKRLIAFAFQHWEQFTAETTSITGFAAYPQHPHIGYLLAHRDIGIALLVRLNIVSAEEVELALLVAPLLD